MGQTPLHVVARNGNEAVAWLLIDGGVNVSAADRSGQTPLHVVVRNEHETVAWLLIGGGADVSAADRSGQTPLHVAARNREEAAARRLIGRGADVSTADKRGWVPLHAAAWNGYEAVARLVMDVLASSPILNISINSVPRPIGKMSDCGEGYRFQACLHRILKFNKVYSALQQPRGT